MVLSVQHTRRVTTSAAPRVAARRARADPVLRAGAFFRTTRHPHKPLPALPAPPRHNPRTSRPRARRPGYPAPYFCGKRDFPPPSAVHVAQGAPRARGVFRGCCCGCVAGDPSVAGGGSCRR